MTEGGASSQSCGGVTSGCALLLFVSSHEQGRAVCERPVNANGYVQASPRPTRTFNLNAGRNRCLACCRAGVSCEMMPSLIAGTVACVESSESGRMTLMAHGRW